jgi:hypothetical protein
MKMPTSLQFEAPSHHFATHPLLKARCIHQEVDMTGKWLLRSVFVVLTMITLGGCIIVPEGHRRPVYIVP